MEYADVPHYFTLDECKEFGFHLTSCDSDGFCAFCGEQPDDSVKFEDK